MPGIQGAKMNENPTIDVGTIDTLYPLEGKTIKFSVYKNSDGGDTLELTGVKKYNRENTVFQPEDSFGPGESNKVYGHKVVTGSCEIVFFTEECAKKAFDSICLRMPSRKKHLP